MNHSPTIVNLIGRLPTHAVATYRRRSLDMIRYIALHHAASSERATPEEIARFHVETRRWPGVAYHWMIGRDGVCYKCWPADTITYCVQGHNTETLCVCLIGNRDEHPAPKEQRVAAVALIRILRLAYAVPINHILGHHEFEGAATACPGQYINMAHIRAEVAALDRGGGNV